MGPGQLGPGLTRLPNGPGPKAAQLKGYIMDRKPGWNEVHQRAMLYPVGPEIPFVQLLRTIPLLVTRLGVDPVQREGIASLLEGAQILVHGDWGDRLDADECQALLRQLAEKIGYDLNFQRFDAASLTEAHQRLLGTG